MKKFIAISLCSLVFTSLSITSVGAIGFRRETKQEVRRETKEEFRERVQVVKDEGKRQRLESINENLEKTVTKAVEHWNTVLAKLDGVIVTIKKDATDEKVLSLITTAETKIAEAKTAVTTFTAKEYVLEVGEGENFGQNVKAKIQELRKDIKDVRDKVRLALDAVKEVRRVQKNTDTNE